MLETHGLKYISTPRPKNSKGKTYGGAAIVVNTEKFNCEKLSVFITENLEVVWGLVKPKTPSAIFKSIIACSFYSPPKKNKNSKMADHVVSTLHMLCSKYPESVIILGADMNQMDIRPILDCGLKLRQIVNKNTRKNKVLDVLIMNVSCYYNSPIIAPPIQPDNPETGQPIDHSVPVCTPHTDRYTRPERSYKIIKYRPIPQSSLLQFGQWIMSQSRDSLDDDLTPTHSAVKSF